VEEKEVVPQMALNTLVQHMIVMVGRHIIFIGILQVEAIMADKQHGEIIFQSHQDKHFT
jgi:hypothetical protein